MYGDKYQQLNFWLGVISHTSVAFRFFHSALTKHGESCWSKVFSSFFLFFFDAPPGHKYTLDARRCLQTDGKLYFMQMTK